MVLHAILVEGLRPAILCLETLLSSEVCSQFERFHLQHVQMVNKTSSFIYIQMTLQGNVSGISFCRTCDGLRQSSALTFKYVN